MTKLLQTLIPILALLVAAASTARSQTTSFYINFNSDAPLPIFLEGDAHIASDSFNLRLTKTDESGAALPNSAGRAYTAPFKFWEAGKKPNMETIIKFMIKPNSGDANPADGLAFFIQPAWKPMGADGASLAVFDASGHQGATMAVEFDTFGNDGVDPSYRHVGIDIERYVSKNTTYIGDDLIGQEVTARINYDGATNAITVYVATAGGRTYEVSYEYDLSALLSPDVKVGIAGATGGNVAIHDIISWYFTFTLVSTGEEQGEISQVA